MTISDELKSHLLYLTYAAQFDFPMKKGIERVFSDLIEPKLPFHSTKEYLTKINKLLSFPGSLKGLIPSTENHSDTEIREFLEVLAKEIEKQYPCAIRSGGIATETGQWVCVEYADRQVVYQQGDVLPDVDGQRTVWEFNPDIGNLSAEDALKREFNIYYLPKTIHGRTDYKNPEGFAAASTPRLLEHVNLPELARMVTLLEAMSKDRQHPLTKTIEKETGMDWTTDEDVWAWFQNLMTDMAARLTQEIPMHRT